jgi:hypothetical protein
VLSNDRAISYAETDVAELLSGGAVAESLFEGRVAGILNDAEADLLGSFVTSSTSNVGGTYGTADASPPTGPTEAVIAALVAQILLQKPPPGLFEGFVDPLTWAYIVQLANFNAGSVRGYLPGEPAPALSQNYGESDRPWHNVWWHLCQSVNGAGGATINNVIMAPGAVGFAMRGTDSSSYFGSDGYISQQFSDAAAGVAGSIIRAKNFLNFSREVTIRFLYGYSNFKQVWTALLKA